MFVSFLLQEVKQKKGKKEKRKIKNVQNNSVLGVVGKEVDSAKMDFFEEDRKRLTVLMISKRGILFFQKGGRWNGCQKGVSLS